MSTYTHGHHESVLRSHRMRTAANSAAYLLPHLHESDSLLDIGAGPGTITADLAGLVGRVTATEIGPEELDLSRATLAARGITNAGFSVQDAHALTFPDGSFDVVHAHQVLQHLADPVQALREMARVTRPGGVVAARDGDYAAFTWWPQLPELEEWLRLYRAAARANGGEPDAGRQAAVVGQGGWPRRHHRHVQHLVLRHARRPRPLGPHVGRSDHRIRAGPPASRRRIRGHRRPAPHQYGLALLGGRGGRLALSPPRRDPLPDSGRLTQGNYQHTRTLASDRVVTSCGLRGGLAGWSVTVCPRPAATTAPRPGARIRCHRA